MTSPLERWYRRLLHAYPGPYRRAHGEEILATLLDAARPGQRLPDPRQAASLLAGGLRARAVLAGGGSIRRLWASGLWLGALLLVAENTASALLAQWQELSRPSVLAILPILGFVALLGGWRRTGLVLVAATAAVAPSRLGVNIGVGAYTGATWSPGLLARYLLPAAILTVAHLAVACRQGPQILVVAAAAGRPGGGAGTGQCQLPKLRPAGESGPLAAHQLVAGQRPPRPDPASGCLGPLADGSAPARGGQRLPQPAGGLCARGRHRLGWKPDRGDGSRAPLVLWPSRQPNPQDRLRTPQGLVAGQVEQLRRCRG
jgi:hypothetical protein